MDDAVEDGVVRGAAFAIVPRAMLAATLEQIDAIVRPPGNPYFLEHPARQAVLPAGHAEVRLPRCHAGRTANTGCRAPFAQHRWARPGSVGTGRLRAEWLEATGQSRRWRRGQSWLPALPARRDANEDPAA